MTSFRMDVPSVFLCAQLYSPLTVTLAYTETRTGHSLRNYDVVLYMCQSAVAITALDDYACFVVRVRFKLAVR